MKYALSIFPTEYAIRIDDLARAAEERGFESLWVPEHTHIPTSRRTRFPAERLPRSTLTRLIRSSPGAAAAVTKTLKLAPSLPGGRARPDRTRQGGRQPGPAVRRPLYLRIGAGWNVEEMENHGTDLKTRRA